MAILQIPVTKEENGYKVTFVPNYDDLEEEKNLRDKIEKMKPVIISQIKQILNED